MTLITVPNIVAFVSAGTEEYQNSGSIGSFFALTTLGNLGSNDRYCTYGSTFSDTISLYCNYGTIDSIYILGQGLSSSTCNNNGDDLVVDGSCSYSSSFSNSEKNDVDSELQSQCVGLSSCDFDLSTISFPGGCTSDPYITINCSSDEIYGYKKGYIALMLVGIDLLAIFFFWCCMMSHGNYEYKELDEVNGSVLDGSDFAVVVKKLPTQDNILLLRAKLWKHIEETLKKHKDLAIRDDNDENAFYVADINFGMSDYGIMKYYLERTNLIKEQIILKIKIDILPDSLQTEAKKEKLKKTLQKRLDNVEKRKLKNELNYQKFLEKSKQTIVKAFVTFKSMEGKLRFLEIYNVGWCKRKCRKSKLKHLEFENKVLDVRTPTAPSLILWENLGVKMKER